MNECYIIIYVVRLPNKTFINERNLTLTMNKEVLREIGLTDSEIEVYFDLVKHGESLASEIANRVKISRTYIYDSIRNLINKGLITYVIKNNRKYFKALEVKKLLEYLDERKAEMEKQKQDILSLIKELKFFQIPTEEKPIVEVFEGKEGLKTILNDIVKTGKDAIGWGATDKIKNYLPDWFLKKYIKEREKKKINLRQLYAEDTGVLKSPRAKFKAIPKEFSSPVTFGSYRDKIVIFFWSEIPVVIRVINKEIADSFRKHFEFLWRQVKA